MNARYANPHTNAASEPSLIGEARGYDWERECAHTRIRPDALGLAQEALQTSRLRQRCPDCRRAVELRIWQPTAGGWHIGLRELAAAGRRWSWRYDESGWRLIV